MELLRERCSALGHLMVGAELGNRPYEFNKTQSDRWTLIQNNITNSKSLTPAMQRDLDELSILKDKIVKPELSKGAKTHVRNKWYGDYYEYQKRFSNVYTINGNEQEDHAIRELGKLLGYPFASKNTKFYENEWIHGSPDWLPKGFVVDTKCVFEPSGLDFDQVLDMIYVWQIKGYCWLTGKDFGVVAKILCNKSETTIRHQARVLWLECSPDNSWNDLIPEDFIDDVRDLYDFESKRPIEERINLHKVDLTQNDIELIKQQIELARDEYYKIKSPLDYNKELIALLKRA
jgi:hypothetical protein